MSRRPTVLLVEDEPDLVHFAQLTLRAGGYRVVTAPDGEAALASVQRRRPDLVLLDLRLPRLSGWEVLAALQATDGGYRLPIVVITATADETDRARAQAAGAAGYLVKPVSAKDLIAAAGRALAAAGAPTAEG